MRIHRIQPRTLITLIVGITLLALLAAACGGGDDASSETAAAVDSTEVVDDHDEAVDDHDDGDAHEDELVAATPEADHEEHDEAVDDHDDGDVHDAEAAHTEIDEHEARTITVMASDFAFGPTEIHAKVGETIRLVLVNDGTVLHDITVVDFHGEASAVSSVEHEHDDAGTVDFHTAAESGETTELLFVATEAGEFELICTVPGHEQLGMVGSLVVEEA